MAVSPPCIAPFRTAMLACRGVADSPRACTGQKVPAMDDRLNGAARDRAIGPGPSGPQPDIVRLAAWLVVGAITLVGLYLGQGVLIPLAIAFLISFALSPLVTWLVRRGLPRVLSVLIVLSTVVALIAALGLLIGSQVRMLSSELPSYQNTIRAKINDLGQRMQGPGIFDGAWQTVDAVQKEVEQAVSGGAATEAVTRVEVIPEPVSPFRTAIDWLLPALAPVATMGIVLVFVFLALLDRGDLRDRLIRMLGGNLHRSTDALEEAGRRISRYLLMQLVVNLTYGIPMALGLWLIGVPGWILWGTLAALMRFIPYVGPMLSAIFPLALAFAVDAGWNMVLLTLGLIVFLELVSNNIVEPLLYGTSTGLSALALIAAATFWTALWGPVGLILSTPLTVCLLVIGRNLPQLQFLETLLGSSAVLDVPTRIYQRLLAGDPDEAVEIACSAIDDTSLPEFHDRHGIALLKQASDDFLTSARAEHRLRVMTGLDRMLDDLHEEYPPPDAPSDAPPGPPRVACIGGKWEIDNMGCEMLCQALAFQGIAAIPHPAGAPTARHLDRMELDGIEILCLSYFSRDPELAARALCRRLRRRWPKVRIVLALWNAPEALVQSGPSQAGADALVTSISEAVQRIEQMISPERARRRQIATPPENDAERVAALHESNILDGHARDALNTIATRAAEVFDVGFAVITAIDEDREFIIGQSMELPGLRSAAAADMIVMPRADAVCDHVVAGDEILVIPDTQRDPRFTDHPAITSWNTRFYAGAPLRTADGLVLGALCLLDTEPRELTEDELDLLEDLADDVAEVITGDEAADDVSPDESDDRSAVTGQRVPE